MWEVVPARTSLTLHPPSPPTVHQLLRLELLELSHVNYCHNTRLNEPSEYQEFFILILLLIFPKV